MQIRQNSDHLDYLSPPILSNQLDKGKGQYEVGQPRTSSQGKAFLHNFYVTQIIHSALFEQWRFSTNPQNNSSTTFKSFNDQDVYTVPVYTAAATTETKL